MRLTYDNYLVENIWVFFCFTPKDIQRYPSNSLYGSSCLNEYLREYHKSSALNISTFSFFSWLWATNIFFFYFHCHQLPRVWSFHFYSRYANDFWIVPDYLHFCRLCAVLKCLFLDHVSSLVDLPPSGSACTKNLFLRQKLEYSTSKADHSRFFSSSSIWSMQYRVLPKDKP